MAQEPFLLDPRFKGTLDGDAFRRRYLEVHRGRWWVGCLYCLVPLPFLIPSLVFLILGLTRHHPDDWEMSTSLSWIAALPFAFVLLLFVARLVEYAFHRRMGLRGVRVAGKTVTCLRKFYSHGEDTPGEYVVEVVYTARSPSGVELRGVKALRRDDLLNVPLPSPGTPVVVLVLSDKRHTIL